MPDPGGEAVGAGRLQAGGVGAPVRDGAIRAASSEATPEATTAAISEVIRRLGGGQSELIEVLHAIQSLEGYLSRRTLHQVARELQLPLSQVVGVASFYHLFRLTPPEPHRCALCFGTACFVNGAPRLRQALIQRLGPDALAAAPGGGDRWSADGRGGGGSGQAHRRSGSGSGSGSGDGSGDGASGGRRLVDPEQAAPCSGERRNEGWRLERSGCQGACGAFPVLRLDDGPAVPVPLEPAASLAERLGRIGLPPEDVDSARPGAASACGER